MKNWYPIRIWREGVDHDDSQGLVIGARSIPGNPYDGHTLAEALEQAAIPSDVNPEVAIVDRGYKDMRSTVSDLPPGLAPWHNAWTARDDPTA